MRRQYKYTPLTNAKLVGRRHSRDIPLPGLKELENAFVSRSDNAITMRPDFNPTSESLLAVSGSMEFDAFTDDANDYLNSATGLYGTDDLIWLSKMAPLTWDGTTSEIACSGYSTGTVSIANGGTLVTGAGTSWLQNAWPGAMIEFANNGVYYRISSIDNNRQLVITEELQEESHSGVSYKIYQNHQPLHANYKLNLQPFTSGMIYSCPTITMPVNSGNICGPFYASVAETSTSVGWSELDDDTDMDVQATIDSTQQCATSGTLWMAFVGFDSASDPVLASSSDPSDDWDLVTGPSNFDLSGHIFYNNGYFYVTGRNTSTSKMSVALSADGSVWTIRDHPSINDTAMSITGNGALRMIVVPDGNTTKAYYSDDQFTTWTEVVYFGVAYEINNAAYAGGYYILISSGNYFYSADAVTWSWGIFHKGGGWNSVAYSSSLGMWLFAGNNSLTDSVATATAIDGTLTYKTPAPGVSAEGALWADDKFLVVEEQYIYSSPDGISFTLDRAVSTLAGTLHSGAYSTATREIVYPANAWAIDEPQFLIGGVSQTTTEWSAAEFEPLSDEYRSLSHSVLDGYVVLVGCADYQSGSGKWEYYPRRIRWSTPLTYNDFESDGSGTGDLDGSGALLDSRTVNGRIVTFESSQIGAISPRGYADDPWEYDIIKQNIRSISNPVVVDDVCYFIDDTGLMRTTNGITVDEPPFSFDLSEFDDFNADIPVWLTYHPELESLAIYNPAATNKHVYLIEVSSGNVSRLELKSVANDSSALDPKSLVCVEHSSDRRMLVGYNPRNDDLDTMLVAELSSGDTVTGKDEWTSTASDDTYFVTDVQTPEDYIVGEGNKTGIKHALIRTYCDGTSSATNPVVAIQCKSIEDADWHDNGDRTGTTTVTDAACTGSGTAWSNLIKAGDNTANAVTIPCLATQARLFTKTAGVFSDQWVLGTDYTITGTKEITPSAAIAVGTDLYAYWENTPFIKAKAGDLIQTTEGWHMVTAITNATEMTLDHYMSSGETDATATHHPAERMPVGDGEVKIGISKLTEGVRMRFIIMADAAGDATVAKLVGYSIGHIPAGRKIVEVGT